MFAVYLSAIAAAVFEVKTAYTEEPLGKTSRRRGEGG